MRAQSILKAEEKRARAAGFLLSALLARAKVKRANWDSWMGGRSLPRAASLEAIKAAARELAGLGAHTGFEVAL